MIGQGDSVYVHDDAWDTVRLGDATRADIAGRGIVVGWRGLYDAVVQWGDAGAYVYAIVPVRRLSKYEARSHK